MSNWSSYKGQKLLTEGWRSYLKGDLYSGEKVEELFGMGKKKKPQVRGSVSLNMLSEATGWASEVIQDVRKGPDQQPEGGRDWHERNAQLAQNPQLMELAQNTDEVAMITEFENMVTGQQFELISEQSPFERDDYRGGTAQTGHVRDPEAEEGEDLPLTFEPDGYENITNFIEIIKDSPEHVEKFVTELKRAGFSNCVDTLGCKKPAVEPGATGLVRKFRGPGGVNVSGVGGDTGLKGGAKIDKKKEPEKITTQQGTTAIILRPDGAMLATDKDGDGKIDDVTPMVERVMELLRQLCAYEVYPEDQRDQAMEQLEDEVRPALEAAGTNELGQLIKELEEEIAQQGECVVPAQITDPHGDAGQITDPHGDARQIGTTQDLDQIIIDYGKSKERALAMAAEQGLEGFDDSQFDSIWMAMAKCNDPEPISGKKVKFQNPEDPEATLNEAVDYSKCEDLGNLDVQFVTLTAKAIAEVTDEIKFEEFFLNFPLAQRDDDGGGEDDDQGKKKGEDDGQGGGEDDDQGKKKGEDDDQNTTTTYGIPQNWKPKGDALKGQRWIENSYKLLGKDAGKTSWDDDLRDFVEKIGKVKFGGSLSERKKGHGFDAEAVAKIMGGKEDAERLSRALKLMKNRNQKGTGAYAILMALSKLKKRETRGDRAEQIKDYLQQLYSAIRKSVGTPGDGGPGPDHGQQGDAIDNTGRAKGDDALAKAKAAGTEGDTPADYDAPGRPERAAESLLRESAIDRWQQLAGIKKRV